MNMSHTEPKSSYSQDEVFDAAQNLDIAQDDDIDQTIKFPFMKLPAETRNSIYEHAYINKDDNYIGKDSITFEDFRKEASKVRNLAFSMACRQIYEETCGIFFSLNGFSFEDPDVLLRFLQSIGIKNRERLTKLAYIHHNGYEIKLETTPTPDGNRRPEARIYKCKPLDFFAAFRYLRSCLNLKTLDIFLLAEMRIYEAAQCLRLDTAKELLLGGSTIIRWSAPTMLTVLRRRPSFNQPCYSKHLPTIGVCKYRKHVEILLCSRQVTTYPINYEVYSSRAKEEFAQQICQVKADKRQFPQPVDPRFPYGADRLPNVFSDSRRKTELFGTNFKTDEEKKVARIMQELNEKVKGLSEIPLKNIEYREGTKTVEDPLQQIFAQLSLPEDQRTPDIANDPLFRRDGYKEEESPQLNDKPRDKNKGLLPSKVTAKQLEEEDEEELAVAVAAWEHAQKLTQEEKIEIEEKEHAFDLKAL